jgi:catechol 2,3-dioxygenase-like lactoylglutathione lyase family enzyme
MSRTLAQVTLVVRDYEEAIAFFTKVMRFELVEDTPLTATKRWVVVAPSTNRGAAILLAKAATADQTNHIGNQTGDRVSFFLETDDFWSDYRHLTASRVTFAEPPREEPYGTVAVFRDLYRNKWDLIERRKQ